MSENHMNESGRAGGSGEVCLDVQDLKMHFKLKSGLFSKPKILKAVDGVSFSIGKGETMGLVGESGCGKTTVGRSILRLYEATDGKNAALDCGHHPFYGRPDAALPEKDADDFPGSLHIPGSQEEYRRYYRGAHVGA